MSSTKIKPNEFISMNVCKNPEDPYYAHVFEDRIITKESRNYIGERLEEINTPKKIKEVYKTATKPVQKILLKMLSEEQTNDHLKLEYLHEIVWLNNPNDVPDKDVYLLLLDVDVRDKYDNKDEDTVSSVDSAYTQLLLDNGIFGDYFLSNVTLGQIAYKRRDKARKTKVYSAQDKMLEKVSKAIDDFKLVLTENQYTTQAEELVSGNKKDVLDLITKI